MSRGALGKNNWALFLMLLAGIMLGGFIGNAAAGVSGASVSPARLCWIWAFW